MFSNPAGRYWGEVMQLPKIDIGDVPQLESATGMFGSLSDMATGISDDRIVVLMVYVYDTIPPETLA